MQRYEKKYKDLKEAKTHLRELEKKGIKERWIEPDGREWIVVWFE